MATVMAWGALLLLSTALLGVATARSPLGRLAYWGWLMAALAVQALAFIALGALLDALEATTLSDQTLALGLLTVFSVWTLSIGALCHVAARRLLDAAVARWWALTALAPPALLVIGAFPTRTRAAGGARIADTFR